MLDEDRIGDLVVQWGQAWEQGRELSVDELCQDDPELKDEVADRVQSVKDMNWLNEPDDESDDFLSLPDFATVMMHADETQLPAITLTIDEFTKAIADSGLMTGKEVDGIQQRSKDAQELARLLIRERKLTNYQAEQICKGNTKGLVLGNYVILGKIGAGGMGQVFKARHRRMKRVVALKVLPEHAVNSPTAVERFHREVEAAAKLEHPNIVVAYDADESDGTHFLVMQYVDGQDLATLVQRRGRLSVSKAVDCILQAAKGLEFAHGEGVIHRDIKPANLLIDSKGCVKVLDMGLALLDASNADGSYAATQAHLTQDGTVMGTVDYMSPEQALQTHHADARSDIYSLGCTLYYLLTAKPIYGGGTLMAKMLAHREEEIPMLSAERDDIPEKLTDIFRKMVAKIADERYPTMTALLEEIDALVSEFGDSWQEDESDASSSVAVEPEVDATSKETSSAELDDTLDITPKVTPHSAPVVPVIQPAGNRSRLFAGGLVGLLMVGLIGYWVFGIIFTVETPDGIIQIETNVTDVEIFVDNEKVVYITDPKDNTKIKVEIPKGAETLQVSKEGFEADVKEFRLKTVKGPVKVSFVPLEKPVVGDDAHRQLAEWVLGIGGEVRLTDHTSFVAAIANLPDEAFTVRDIRVLANSGFTDAHLAELSHLCEGMQLSGLWLRETAITDAGVAHLVGLSIIQLDLNDTAITNAGIEYVTKVPNLKTLSVSGTKVNDEGVREIATIRSLENLHLWLTPITNTALEHLKQIPSLKSLNINDTAISDEGLQHLTVHSSLQFLLASGCEQITDAGLKHLAGLTNLSTLELLYNPKFTDAGIVELAKLKNLERLAINGSEISDAGLQALSEQFPNLSFLSLGGTDVSDAGLEHLRKLDKLNTVHLAATSINGMGLIHLKSLAHLEDLLLTKTKVNDDALIFIADLQNLRDLGLRMTPISDAGIANLTGLKKLDHVDLRDTKVTVQGVTQLQKALPNCKIDYVADPYRAVAEWVLGIGGEVSVTPTKTGRTISIPAIKDLPDEAFKIHTINVPASLDFTDDQLAELSRLGQGIDLGTLSLRETAITDDGLAHLAGLSIKKIDLVDTEITDAGIEYVKQLPLIQLNVAGTKVSDEGIREIATIRSLTFLGLTRTSITDTALEHLEQLPNLGTLHLAGTSISNDGLQHLAVHRTLRELQFNGCDQIADAGMMHLSGLTDLAALDLYGTKVTDTGIIELAKLNKLTNLGLTSCEISDVGLQAISEQFPSMSDLTLSGTDVTDTGLEHLKKLSKLNTLRLVGTAISDAGIPNFAQLKNLTGVDLRNTKVTAQGVAELQKALPNCKIEYVADPQRALAEWVLAIGGRVVLYGQTAFTTLIEDLPAEAFKVHNIRVPANFTDEHLAELCRRCEGIPVRDLYLNKTAITDDGLAHLTGLSIQQVVLTDTEITNAAIEHLKQVRNLMQLSVSRTQLTDEGMRELATISSLTGLQCFGTPITDAAMEHLKQIPELKSLGINDTAISDEGLQHLTVHTSLQSLQASGCDQITDAGMKHLAVLTNLSVLELYYNRKVTDAGIAQLARLNKLDYLGIGPCEISDAGVKTISEQFPNLSHLAIGGTDVTDAGLEYLKKLSKLRDINLGNTGVNGKGLIHLTSLAHLESLRLSGSHVSDDALDSIAEHQNLRDLALRKTRISDAGIMNLAQLKKLDHLDLRDTNVTSQGVAELQKALPNCKIEWGDGDASSEDALSDDPMPLEFEDGGLR